MQALVSTTLSLMLFTIPLIFTTINYELFEFPKFILLLTGTIVLVVAWLVHTHQSDKSWRTALIDLWPAAGSQRLVALGILAVLATQALATVFSIDPYTSFWGYYSRFHQGLLTTICYTLIYFIALRFLTSKSTQKLIKVSVFTSFLISLYAVAQRLGIDKSLWVQDVVNRPFSTLGQPNWLAAYLLPNLFLALYLFISSPKKPLTHYLLFIILFTALLLTRSRSGLIGFALAYLTYWALLTRNLSFPKIKTQLLVITGLSLLISITVGTAFTPSLSQLLRNELAPPPPANQGTQLESGGTESGDIRKIVWTGAFALAVRRPLFGTGPETFAYSYYWTRPVAHNYTSEWDFLYNKAHNEYLNFAATSGLLGLSAYLLWHFGIFHLALARPVKSKKAKKISEARILAYSPVLAASLVGFTVTNFFGFSVIPVYLITIVASALPSGLARPKQASPKSPPYLSVILASCFLILILPLRLFTADLFFNKGKSYLDAGRPEAAEPYLTRAVSSRPQEPLYRSYQAETYAQLAAAASSQHYQQLALQAVDFVKSHNPYHLNYLKSTTKTYLTLTQLDPAYHQQAASELVRARELAPTDPKLAYNLGLVYSRLGNTEEATRQLQDAITLKSDYPEPYYALTLLYEETKATGLIPPLLRQAKASLPAIPASLQGKFDQYLP